MSIRLFFENMAVDEGGELAKEFMNTFFRMMPESRKSLIDEVMPLYCEDIMDDHSDEYLAKRDAWITHHNLHSPRAGWLPVSINTTLLNWKDGLCINNFLLQFNRSTPFSPEETRFQFSHIGWDPTEQSEEVARRCILTSINLSLDEYFDSLRQKAKKMGLIPRPKSRNRESNSDDRVEWLVLRLVKGWSPKRIAMEYSNRSNGDAPKSINAKQVREWTNYFAQILGFVIPTRRGRPPKKSAPGNAV